MMALQLRLYPFYKNKDNLIETHFFNPAPADYQVPRFLREKNVLIYNKELSNAIDTHQIIPKGSIQEIEIRASMIEACSKIVSKSDRKLADVDAYLWSKRNECKKPHHLTVTTDY
jgi:hypothetical protein